MTRTHRLLAGFLAAGALLVGAGCVPAVDPIERLGRKAAQEMGPRHAPGVGTAGALRDRARKTPRRR